MIKICILSMKRHPAWENKEDDHHEDVWAVQYQVSIDKRKKSFWRWVDGTKGGIKPTEKVALKKIWLDVWHSTGGFNLDPD